ncbi:MAG: D-aminoacyl-tRNA deacylase [Caldisericia bacterium]|jgi:D-tyrosyl-tRNA(Tyr) deacylase|nr:D-aminoacyl-tRNA deacylase [Caldisericia bacterium]
MRCVVQRVNEAKVKVNGEIISHIEKGFLVLLGIEIGDNDEDINYLVRKISNLRIFDDENGKLNLSIKDVNGEIMIISQFTLYGNLKGGFRPDFTRAEKGEKAFELYNKFIEKLKKEGFVVKEGVFGAYMQIELINDGPVTLIIDSKLKDF